MLMSEPCCIEIISMRVNVDGIPLLVFNLVYNLNL